MKKKESERKVVAAIVPASQTLTRILHIVSQLPQRESHTYRERLLSVYVPFKTRTESKMAGEATCNLLWNEIGCWPCTYMRPAFCDTYLVGS